jgi:hypothetical protein
MNERIEQLALQCTEYITGTLDGDFEKFDYKKFAELIVRECANYITHKATIETLLGERLMEHFGVEE